MHFSRGAMFAVIPAIFIAAALLVMVLGSMADWLHRQYRAMRPKPQSKATSSQPYSYSYRLRPLPRPSSSSRHPHGRPDLESGLRPLQLPQSLPPARLARSREPSSAYDRPSSWQTLENGWRVRPVKIAGPPIHGRGARLERTSDVATGKNSEVSATEKEQLD